MIFILQSQKSFRAKLEMGYIMYLQLNQKLLSSST